MLTEFDMEDLLFHAFLISDITDQLKYMNKDFVYQSIKAFISWHDLDSMSFCNYTHRPMMPFVSQLYSLCVLTD